MDQHRMQREYGGGSAAQESPSKLSKFSTPFGNGRALKQQAAQSRLPPHVYHTADGAYRHMLRGLENSARMGTNKKQHMHG
jgi:hypothetical protein